MSRNLHCWVCARKGISTGGDNIRLADEYVACLCCDCANGWATYARDQRLWVNYLELKIEYQAVLAQGTGRDDTGGLTDSLCLKLMRIHREIERSKAALFALAENWVTGNE